MTLWIQLHDFSFEEFGSQTFESAMERFRSFDWNREIQCEADAQTAGDDWCQAGLGLDDGAGRSLHICPAAGGVSAVSFRYRDSKGQEVWLVSEKVPADAIENLVKMHFATDDSGIVCVLEAFPISTNAESPED